MPKRYIVMLAEPERAWLHPLIGQGIAPAHALTTPASCLKPTRARPALHGATG
jgi:hypothetical protein